MKDKNLVGKEVLLKQALLYSASNFISYGASKRNEAAPLVNLERLCKLKNTDYISSKSPFFQRKNKTEIIHTFSRFSSSSYALVGCEISNLFQKGSRIEGFRSTVKEFLKCVPSAQTKFFLEKQFSSDIETLVWNLSLFNLAKMSIQDETENLFLPVSVLSLFMSQLFQLLKMINFSSKIEIIGLYEYIQAFEYLFGFDELENSFDQRVKQKMEACALFWNMRLTEKKIYVGDQVRMLLESQEVPPSMSTIKEFIGKIKDDLRESLSQKLLLLGPTFVQWYSRENNIKKGIENSGISAIARALHRLSELAVEAHQE
eukprot:snap_masked-scaffold_1-processed-gene-17.42-mRNA-1 protein AED:1.00 eAED:1.00 QI:0/-1/0/0/-1/1/1/0/315